jgi:hypothetical protein
MDKICEKNGQFCLQLKRNHPEYYDRVQLYFDNLTKDEMEQMSVSVSTQKDHGRIEKRKYVVCSDEGIVANLLDNTRWKHVKAIGMAELKRTVNGETTYEKHFHVLSFVSTADTYATYAKYIGKSRTICIGFWISISMRIAVLQTAITPLQIYLYLEKLLSI